MNRLIRCFLLVLFLIVLIAGGCATPMDHIRHYARKGGPPKDFVKVDADVPTRTIKDIYNPLYEKAFCLRDNGTIHNVVSGLSNPSWRTPFFMFMCPSPVCFEGDIVMHTHPIYSEWAANAQDFHAWREYYRVSKTKNTRFGVYHPAKIQIYQLRPVKIRSIKP